jgi:hypothetical protein
MIRQYTVCVEYQNESGEKRLSRTKPLSLDKAAKEARRLAEGGHNVWIEDEVGGVEWDTSTSATRIGFQHGKDVNRRFLHVHHHNPRRGKK